MSLVNPVEVTLKNNLKVIFRSPLESDAEKLLTHLRKSFGESYRNFNRSQKFWENMSVEAEAKILKEYSEAPNMFMISAFHENRIVANLMIRGRNTEFNKHNADLGIGVEVAYHNSGLGTALMELGIKEARKAKMHRIELTVRTFNEAAIRLYEKCGFSRIGKLSEVAFIDGQYFDEYLFEKIIS